MALGYYTQATTSHSWYVNEDMDLGPSRGVLKIIWGGGRKKISGIYVILQHVRILGICLLGLAHNIKLMLWMTFFFFFFLIFDIFDIFVAAHSNQGCQLPLQALP